MIEENQQPEELKVEDSDFIPKAPKIKPAIGFGGQLAILIAFIGAGIIIDLIVTAIVWTIMTKTSVLDMQMNMFNPAYVNALKVAQLIFSIGVFFIPAVVYARIINKNPLKHLGFIKTVSKRQIFLVFLIAVSALFISNTFAELNQIIPIPKNWAKYFQGLEDENAKATLIIARMNNFSEFLFTLIVVALVPAIVEETLFRGALQTILVKWTKNVWIAILITSILFSLVHGSYYGFLPRAALGVILGFLFFYSKNIWLNILAHFLNNGIIVVSLYLENMKGKLSKESMNDTPFPWYLGILALAFIIGLMKEYKKECVKLGCEQIDNTISPSDNPFE